jgi:hypothetical protein
MITFVPLHLIILTFIYSSNSVLIFLVVDIYMYHIYFQEVYRCFVSYRNIEIMRNTRVEF